MYTLLTFTNASINKYAKKRYTVYKLKICIVTRHEVGLLFHVIASMKGNHMSILLEAGLNFSSE